MKYSGNINYIKCLEHGLNLSQWAIMELMTLLPLWAEAQEIEWETYYYFSVKKILDELPIISESKRTLLRHIEILKEKWLIKHKVHKNKWYYTLTEIGKSFVFIPDDKGVSKMTYPREGMSKMTHKCDKNDILGVTKMTHNNNTSNNNTSNRDISSSLRSEDISCDESQNSWEKKSEIEIIEKKEEKIEKRKLVDDLLLSIRTYVTQYGAVYKAWKRERERANNLARLQGDWGKYLLEKQKTPDEMIPMIISYSLNNRYCKRITNAEEFHANWASVLNQMRAFYIEKKKEHAEYNKFTSPTREIRNKFTS